MNRGCGGRGATAPPILHGIEAKPSPSKGSGLLLDSPGFGRIGNKTCSIKRPWIATSVQSRLNRGCGGQAAIAPPILHGIEAKPSPSKGHGFLLDPQVLAELLTKPVPSKGHGLLHLYLDTCPFSFSDLRTALFQLIVFIGDILKFW